ncbi:zinc-ribbon domain-containing protein [Achromobacter xylosoxidans]|uniref:zinc-ribbon domain-containing protein n=1 Tax=Alcaligenes xylosoxydans xylosoxydans TaxID=85698 RepID=UPI000B49247C|nr:zinc ribbon domain-containing protein [Achromobacter xylosoxidans]
MGILKHLLGGQGSRHGYGGRHGHDGHRGGSHGNPPQSAASHAAGVACNNCGAAQPAGSRYCSQCGTSLAAAACPQCRTALAPGASFCGQCGTAVARTVQP